MVNAKGLTVKFNTRGRTLTGKDFRKMSDAALLDYVLGFAMSLPWKDEANQDYTVTMLGLASRSIKERTEGKGKKEEETTPQDPDRERAIAAILTQQAVHEAERALESAEAQAVEFYNRMVEGKDVQALRELTAVLEDLKGVFKGSFAFECIWDAVKDRIEDEEWAAAGYPQEAEGREAA
jgi:hypothetical protein